MRERLPVDDGGRDHREPDPAGCERPQLLLDPVRIAQREVRDRVEPATALGGDGRAPTVPRPHVGEHRGRSAPESLRSQSRP